jgi:hypothetical protein
VPEGFDRIGLGYQDAVARAIRFAGRPHDVYTRAKVDALLRLARQRLGGASADVDGKQQSAFWDEHWAGAVGT